MNFTNTSPHKLSVADKHAFLSPSKYHWLRYDDEKLIHTYDNHKAAQLGERLHQYASDAINLRIKARASKDALNMFINDAIGFKMASEQILYYSEFCFGKVDAISYNRGILRIHDYKSGIGKCSFDQLRVYAALFCLEYHVRPEEVEQFNLRIYQGMGFEEHIASKEEIQEVIDIIKRQDEVLRKYI